MRQPTCHASAERTKAIMPDVTLGRLQLTGQNSSSRPCRSPDAADRNINSVLQEFKRRFRMHQVRLSALGNAMNARSARRFVAYYRVSTDRQGRSGLGLEAQQKAVRDFLNGGSWEIAGEFVEVESGKRADRPELARALEACRRQKAKLVIAKLDRLSRNLAFIATLMDSGVEFIAVDNPHANKLTIHILAAVAEHEREAISERTKAALAAAKARGTKLGSPDPAGAVKRMGVALKAQTAQFAGNVLPIIREIQNAGYSSHNAIAAQLNARKVATARGGRWTHMQVGNILKRAAGSAHPKARRGVGQWSPRPYSSSTSQVPPTHRARRPI
jgi:DNA invertase Pin-like site-specific DNA recombinase